MIDLAALQLVVRTIGNIVGCFGIGVLAWFLALCWTEMGNEQLSSADAHRHDKLGFLGLLLLGLYLAFHVAAARL